MCSYQPLPPTTCSSNSMNWCWLSRLWYSLSCFFCVSGILLSVWYCSWSQTCIWTICPHSQTIPGYYIKPLQWGHFSLNMTVCAVKLVNKTIITNLTCVHTMIQSYDNYDPVVISSNSTTSLFGTALSNDNIIWSLDRVLYPYVFPFFLFIYFFFVWTRKMIFKPRSKDWYMCRIC